MTRFSKTAALLAALLLWQGSAQAFFCFSFGARGGSGGRSSATLPAPPPPGYFPIWATPWAGSDATGWGRPPRPPVERSAPAPTEDSTGAGKLVTPATRQVDPDTRAPFEEYGPYRFRPTTPAAGYSMEL